MAPRLLDLFCGAGGAAMGYHRAGFEVVGVDNVRQPRYPFSFVETDALGFVEGLVIDTRDDYSLESFDAIHASPPCASTYSPLAARNGNAHEHPDLIAETRELLRATGLPWVIENVEGARDRLRDPVTVCGAERGLGVDGWVLRRHRLFETSFILSPKPSCACVRGQRVISVTGGGPGFGPRLDGKGGRTYKGTADEARAAMGIEWMVKRELNEAIPPAYTELIGRHLRDAVRHERHLEGFRA